MPTDGGDVSGTAGKEKLLLEWGARLGLAWPQLVSIFINLRRFPSSLRSFEAVAVVVLLQFLLLLPLLLCSAFDLEKEAPAPSAELIWERLPLHGNLHTRLDSGANYLPLPPPPPNTHTTNILE